MSVFYFLIKLFSFFNIYIYIYIVVLEFLFKQIKRICISLNSLLSIGGILKILKVTILSSILFLLLVSCKNNPLSVTAPATPGRRDYVWTLDTLKSSFNYFSGLWGSSPSDVWTVGDGADSESRLWHFDGNKWSVYNKEQIICAGNALIGFSKDNVWMVGDEGRIWHYDGDRWAENFVYVQNDGFANILDVLGSNSNDIYAVGDINLTSVKEQRGFILHYDGHQWKEYFKANYISQFNSVLGDNNNVFITGIRLVFKPENFIVVDSAYISRISVNKLNKIYEVAADLPMSLAQVGNDIAFVVTKSLYRYSNGSLEHVMDINNSNFASCVYGRSYSDIFIKMCDGVGHYNGTDIVYLYKFDSNYSYYSGRPMDFGNAIFFNIPHTRNLRGFLK